MYSKPVRWLAVVGFMTLAISATACHSTVEAASRPGDAAGANAPVAPAAVPIAPLVSVPHQLYDASTKPAAGDQVKEITISIEQKTLEIASGVPYEAWTFNGTVPGPILHVRQGDQVKFTLINNGKMEHSLDFHAAQTPWNVNYRNVKVGEKFAYTWTANYPGVFMYHCGTPPVIAHIANGMYGAIIVEPAEGLPPAREYVLVQSEFYAKPGTDGMFHYDGSKANGVQPDYVVFNGYANQYQDKPLTANPGERVRIWVLNAGPSLFSAFHIVGTIFDKAYPDGDPKNTQNGMQTVTVPPGGGYMVELTVPDAGLYPVVTHAFAYSGKGALGILRVGDVQASTSGMTH